MKPSHLSIVFLVVAILWTGLISWATFQSYNAAIHYTQLFATRGLLAIPDKSGNLSNGGDGPGKDLTYHLCRINTKKGNIIGEDNFNEKDEAWALVGIAKYNKADLRK